MELDGSKFEIAEEIDRASTLPGRFYRDPEVFGRVCWHGLGEDGA